MVAFVLVYHCLGFCSCHGFSTNNFTHTTETFVIVSPVTIAAQVPLVTALTGGTTTIRHLDNRPITINLTSVTQPGTERIVKGEGMPISKHAGAKGNLIVKLDVAFPSSLSEQQKTMLRNTLPVA